MQYLNLAVAPGIFNEASDYTAQARWVDGNHIRFYKGQPQPIGGYRQVENTNEAQGIVRGAIDWIALDGRKVIGLGTNLKLYVWIGNTYYDITPIEEEDELTDPFTTTNGSDIVEVTHVNHGRLEGDFVIFDNASAVGGITIDGEYQVVEVIDADTYTIIHSAQATSDATGGGTVDYIYLLGTGQVNGILGLGWGAGEWGMGTWGTPRTDSGILIPPRTWSLTNWGEDLIANPRGGGIYWWDYSNGTTVRAEALAAASDAPEHVQFVLVSPTTRHMIAFGCEPFGSSDPDPMHVRWCTQNDFNSTDAWEPLEENTAGDVQLDHGSQIISAIETSNNEILIFTDTAVYSMVYVGPPQVFTTRLMGTAAGISAPYARATFGAYTWWMGPEDFYIYDGRVRTLPCEVRSYIFSRINNDQRDKIFAATNRIWQEVWWFYPSENSTEIDSYVAYNWNDNTWHYGDMERVSWIDRNEISPTPIAWDVGGLMYEHELQDQEIEDVFVESGFMRMGEADDFVFLDRVVPDFERINRPIRFYINGKKYPASEVETKGPIQLRDTTEKQDFRLRAKNFSIKLESDSSIWRLSSLKLRVVNDGKR